MFGGFDLSLTGTGISIIDENYTLLYLEKLEAPKGVFGVERLFFLENLLCSILEKYSLKYVCIEGAALGQKDSCRLFDLGEWNGIVKLNLFKKSIPFITPAPMQLKKYISGSGKNTGKETVILDIYKKWGIEIRENNQADAYVLSRICRDYYISTVEKILPTSITKYQQEVLEKLLTSFNSQFLI